MAAASYRFARQPRWLAGHVLVLAAAVTMVFLGHWQLTVSERKGFSIQNFGYALQWWAFSIFAVVFWVKILHDRAGGARRDASTGARTDGSQPAEPAATADEPVAYRRYVMPTRDGSDSDPEVARYNAYLASLAGDGERPAPRATASGTDDTAPGRDAR